MKNRIFVIDDNEDVRYCYVELLGHAGYEVKEASDGQTAFEMLEQHLDPELIVLDLEMPQMNGFKFLSKLRKDQRFSSIPIIMSSGHFLAPEIAEVLEIQFLPKPSESLELINLVRSTLAQH